MKMRQTGFKDDNPACESSNYHVYLNDITKQTELVNYIQGLEHVRKVNQSEQASKTLGSINKLVSYVSIGVIGILLVISGISDQQYGIHGYFRPKGRNRNHEIHRRDRCFCTTAVPSGRYCPWGDRCGNPADRTVLPV